MREFGPRPTLGELQRSLPASRAACLRGHGYFVGPERLKRQVARWRTLHLLRQQRRDPPTARMRRQSHRLLSVSDLARFDYWPWLASTLLQPRLIFARFACR